jgi:hypothetical protein
MGGEIISESSSGKIQHFGTVGLIAAGFTVLTLWLAGRLSPFEASGPSASSISLAAAAQATADAGEPMVMSADHMSVEC